MFLQSLVPLLWPEDSRKRGIDSCPIPIAFPRRVIGREQQRDGLAKGRCAAKDIWVYGVTLYQLVRRCHRNRFATKRPCPEHGECQAWISVRQAPLPPIQPSSQNASGSGRKPCDHQSWLATPPRLCPDIRNLTSVVPPYASSDMKEDLAPVGCAGEPAASEACSRWTGRRCACRASQPPSCRGGGLKAQ